MGVKKTFHLQVPVMIFWKLIFSTTSFTWRPFYKRNISMKFSNLTKTWTIRRHQNLPKVAKIDYFGIFCNDIRSQFRVFFLQMRNVNSISNDFEKIFRTNRPPKKIWGGATRAQLLTTFYAAWYSILHVNT